MLGRERALPMLEDAIHVDHGAEVVVVEQLDFVDLVRRAEAVEEMQERNARSSVAACAINARSMASWTEFDESIA